MTEGPPGKPPTGPAASVPLLQPAPGVQVRRDHPAAYIDPVKAVTEAAKDARYTVLAKNRADVEKLTVAALAAWTAHGEATATYDHKLKSVAAPDQGDWARAWSAFTAKLLQGGYGYVTRPHTETWQHPQTQQTVLRFVARVVPLRPAETPEVVSLRSRATTGQ